MTLKFLLIAVLTHASLVFADCTKPFDQPSVAVKASKPNPILAEWTLAGGRYPPFDQIAIADIFPAFTVAMDEARAILAAVKAVEHPTFANTIVPLSQNSLTYEKVSAIFSVYGSTFATPEFEEIQKATIKIATALDLERSADPEIFYRVAAVYATRAQLDADQQRILDDVHRSFIKGGILLAGAERQRFEAISLRLSELTLTFSSNIKNHEAEIFFPVTDVADLAGVSADYVEIFRKEAEKRGMSGYVVPFTDAAYAEIMLRCRNTSLQRQIYMAAGTLAYGHPKYDNVAVLKEIATLRHERAQLLGDKTFAHDAMEGTLAQSPERVQAFIMELLNAYGPVAQREEAELEDFAHQHGAKLEPWTRSFWLERLKEQTLKYDETELRPYFEVGAALSGVFEVIHRLFGVNFIPVQGLPVPHPDVLVYEVRDRDGKLLAHAMGDLYARLGTKKSGAWAQTLLTSSAENGHRVLPFVSFNTNFTKAPEGQKTLLRPSEVNTLFHELGHILHMVVSKTRYSSQSGTQVVRDLVEFPSQFLENFAFEEEVLALYARHHETGEPLPATLREALIKSGQFRAATAGVKQLSLGVIDQAWHNGSLLGAEGTIGEIERRLLANFPVTILPFGFDTAISPDFSHIFGGGYAANYYSYKWAEVLDADAFQIFKDAGLFNQEIADRFRREILEVGDSVEPGVAYRRFAGRDPDVRGLLIREGVIEP